MFNKATYLLTHLLRSLYIKGYNAQESALYAN